MTADDNLPEVDLNAYIEALERPFWEPIGRYLFRFGMLERKVDEALSLLMGIEFFQHGEFVLNEIDFLARAHLLIAYCHRESGADLLAEMKEAIKEIEEQNTFRNTLVHGPWLGYFTNYKDGESAAQKVYLSRRHNLKSTTFTPTDILANATKVGDLIAQITRISRSVAALRSARVEPPPSP